MVTTRFYLDARAVKAGCPAPLKIVFNLKGRHAMLGTGVKLLPSQWDAVRQVVTSHPRKNHLNELLAGRKVDVGRMLYSLACSGELEGLTAAQIKKRIERELLHESSPGDGPEPQEPVATAPRFVSWLDAFIARHSVGTQRIYLATRRRLETYLGVAGLEKLTFEQMDAGWLESFDRWLSKTSPSRNARNIHLRNIRAVFNDAITDDAITCYPFRRLKIRPEATRKRALSPSQWARLMDLRIPGHMERYRDCFKLIFMLCGINIVDLCNLTTIIDGRAEYRRAKTHRLYSIRLEPEAEAIIAKYRGEGHVLDYLDTCADYRSFYNRLCVALRYMGERIGVDGLSTYWARHTWATFAARLDVPKETIAAALGHGGNTVTDIYIDFDQRKVDEANRKVIDFAMGGITH